MIETLIVLILLGFFIAASYEVVKRRKFKCKVIGIKHFTDLQVMDSMGRLDLISSYVCFDYVTGEVIKHYMPAIGDDIYVATNGFEYLLTGIPHMNVPIYIKVEKPTSSTSL
jgi:hypothetical protein